MNLKQILEDHKKWCESNKAEGKRADLSEANLSRADLSGANLSDTCVYGFYLGKDFGYAWDNKKEVVVKIGCKEHNLTDWLKNYEEIGKAASYSKNQIDLYGDMLKSIKRRFK